MLGHKTHFTDTCNALYEELASANAKLEALQNEYELLNQEYLKLQGKVSLDLHHTSMSDYVLHLKSHT
jgi:hypothetical protein